jgi:hypothetical protein
MTTRRKRLSLGKTALRARSPERLLHSIKRGYQDRDLTVLALLSVEEAGLSPD